MRTAPECKVSIRPAACTDADGLRRFLSGLSTSAAYSRFFTGLGRVPDRMLALLLRRGGDQEVMLALHGGDVVGHAMYTAVPERDGVAELALVVADAWQRRGVGQLLARTLLAAAPQSGVRQLGFTILAENQPAIRLVTKLWPHARPALGGGMYEYLVPLTDLPQAGGANRNQMAGSRLIAARGFAA
jgi:L-amino acid N-acyltransferase YncA